ncbi:MAG: multidrug ABC transporter ATP-binding protein, partial [bacterium (Candidatus Stahlbacteria) CG23_combo_of_CG06-09_8_20_14_all_40_9]
LDTVVGERGIALSGGQRQRVTLTRSIIKKPSILILDDALSSVDTEKEAEIIDNLSEFLKERTTFIVSHRLKSLIDADEIIVLQDGEIIERGIHQKLIKMNGFYANLFRLQQLEEVL